ncbi:MAG TPA: NHL repeat-containing protein, partial [Acidimicrobiales bacterium]|nr:NHL repeat-containing protein [Acidimicrobiales bacterium]
WIANFKGGTVSLLNTAGQVLSPAGGFTQGNLAKPQGLAIDQQGNVWIASFGTNTVVEYPKGDPTQARVISGGGLEKSFGVAVDAQGNIWVTDGAESTKPGQVTRIAPDGSFLDQQPITGGGLRSPQGIAIDSDGNAWVANLFSASVTEIGSNGKVVPGSPLRAGGSLKGPWGIAVDGSDHVWVAGFLNQNVVELCGVKTDLCPPGLHTGEPISPKKAGYTSKALEHLTAIAIDQSGNVWAANNWSSGSPLHEYVGGNGLVEMIGVATPVKTPMIGLPQSP